MKINFYKRIERYISNLQKQNRIKNTRKKFESMDVRFLKLQDDNKGNLVRQAPVGYTYIELNGNPAAIRTHKLCK